MSVQLFVSVYLYVCWPVSVCFCVIIGRWAGEWRKIDCVSIHVHVHIN